MTALHLGPTVPPRVLPLRGDGLQVSGERGQPPAGRPVQAELHGAFTVRPGLAWPRHSAEGGFCPLAWRPWGMTPDLSTGQTIRKAARSKC